MPPIRLCCLVLTTVLPAQVGPVTDFNRTPLPGTLVTDENQVVEMGGVLFYAGSDAAGGVELWRVGLTGGAAQRVADIAPGRAGSSPAALTVVGATLFFSADDGLHGRELWRSDGTAAGTVMVVDLEPGPLGSIAAANGWLRPMGVLGARVVFPTVVAGLAGLHVSDGTPAGTVLLRSGLTRLDEFVAVNNRLLFHDVSSLWVTDGTSGGTQPLQTFYGGPFDVAVVGNRAYFGAAGTWAQGYELWASDGTVAGTVLVRDLWPGGTVSESSYPAQLTTFGNLLLFTADDGVHGRELWRSDGTAGGTAMVADLGPGGSSGLYWWARQPLPVVGAYALFTADDGVHGQELWRSDGTAAGTTLVADLMQGAASGLPAHWLLASGASATRACFAGRLPAGDVELFVTDATGAGTTLFADLTNGSSTPRAFLATSTGDVAFVADQPAGPAVWLTDGTPAGTRTVATGFVTTQDHSQASGPTGLVEFGGALLFAATDGVHGYEPCRSDGSAGGTGLLGDLVPGPAPSIWNGDPVAASTVDWPTVRAGAFLYWIGDSGNLPTELWRSDGTPAGTRQLRRFDPYDSAGLRGWALRGAPCRGELLFLGYETTRGWGLWQTDSATAAVQRLVGVPLATSGRCTLKSAGNGVYALGEGIAADLLFVSDGTTAGSALAAVLPRTSNQRYELAALAGQQVLFLGRNAATGDEPWRSDGTAAGTGLLRDLRPGPAGSAPRALTSFGRRVLFTADDGVAGREPWCSDGTAAGTFRLVDAAPGLAESQVVEFAVADGHAWFASSSSGQDTLWRTDGTPGGTVAVLTLPVTGTSRAMANLTAVGSRKVVLAAYTPLLGLEPWVSDGTSSGTRPLADVQPGSGYSLPGRATLAGGNVYFAADDGRHGHELQLWFPGATSQAVGRGCIGTGALPELRVGDPVLGGNLPVDGDGPALATGLLLFGLQAWPSLPLAGCELHVALPAPLLLPIATDAAGHWAVPPVPVPNLPALRFAQLALQAVLVDGVGALGFSQGRWLTLGD